MFDKPFISLGTPVRNAEAHYVTATWWLNVAICTTVRAATGHLNRGQESQLGKQSFRNLWASSHRKHHLVGT